jgi:hypothetical protein
MPVFQAVSFLWVFPPKACTFLSHASHMPCPPHPPWLDLPNDTSGQVQIKFKFIIPWFSVTSMSYAILKRKQCADLSCKTILTACDASYNTDLAVRGSKHMVDQWYITAGQIWSNRCWWIFYWHCSIASRIKENTDAWKSQKLSDRVAGLHAKISTQDLQNTK